MHLLQNETVLFALGCLGSLQQAFDFAEGKQQGKKPEHQTNVLVLVQRAKCNDLEPRPQQKHSCKQGLNNPQQNTHTNVLGLFPAEGLEPGGGVLHWVAGRTADSVLECSLCVELLRLKVVAFASDFQTLRQSAACTGFIATGL